MGRFLMKVQLVVVQGKPEGKVIPLAGPIFRIGRGETCHLRPNSEQVSREHSEFAVTVERVTVRDLGSRNGTVVNGQTITASQDLKDGDLIQIGPLTFAISIQGAPVVIQKDKAPPAKAGKAASPDDISQNDIESWLVADSSSPTPDRPSGVYGGDTQTISNYRGGGSGKSTPVEEDESIPDDAETRDEIETIPEDEPADEEPVDESNPFNAGKKKPAAPSKPASKDSSDAASDILRKMMERRKGPR